MTSVTHDGPQTTRGADSHGPPRHAAVNDAVDRHPAGREPSPAWSRGARRPATFPAVHAGHHQRQDANDLGTAG